jgi:hypothetical protein
LLKTRTKRLLGISRKSALANKEYRKKCADILKEARRFGDTIKVTRNLTWNIFRTNTQIREGERRINISERRVCAVCKSTVIGDCIWYNNVIRHPDCFSKRERVLHPVKLDNFRVSRAKIRSNDAHSRNDGHFYDW